MLGVRVGVGRGEGGKGVGCWVLGVRVGGEEGRGGSGELRVGRLLPVDAPAEDREIVPLPSQTDCDANADLDSLIEWMFALSPTERLAALQGFVNSLGVDRGVGGIAFAPLGEENHP